MKKQRKHYAPGEKVAILRRHLLPEEQKANLLSISLPRGLVLRACKHHGVTEDLSACSTNVHL